MVYLIRTVHSWVVVTIGKLKRSLKSGSGEIKDALQTAFEGRLGSG